MRRRVQSPAARVVSLSCGSRRCCAGRAWTGQWWGPSSRRTEPCSQTASFRRSSYVAPSPIARLRVGVQRADRSADGGFLVVTPGCALRALAAGHHRFHRQRGGRPGCWHRDRHALLPQQCAPPAAKPRHSTQPRPQRRSRIVPTPAFALCLLCDRGLTLDPNVDRRWAAMAAAMAAAKGRPRTSR